jgi:sulfate transport system permease protein
MGLTLTWLSVIILIPLAGLFLKTLELSPAQFWEILTSRRTLNALKLRSASPLPRPASIW